MYHTYHPHPPSTDSLDFSYIDTHWFPLDSWTHPEKPQHLLTSPGLVWRSLAFKFHRGRATEVNTRFLLGKEDVKFNKLWASKGVNLSPYGSAFNIFLMVEGLTCCTMLHPRRFWTIRIGVPKPFHIFWTSFWTQSQACHRISWRKLYICINPFRCQKGILQYTSDMLQYCILTNE